jgi:putative transposase
MADHHITYSPSPCGNVLENAGVFSLMTERPGRKVYRAKGEPRPMFSPTSRADLQHERRHSTIGYFSPVQFESARAFP